jgi:hypothetical protein
MSKYFDSKSSFLEPTVKQYGNHMIMTNVSKQTRPMYINIDTKYRDENTRTIGKTSLANCNITLPEVINDVTSMFVYNAEVPITFYSISSALGNHFFQVINMDSIPNVGTLIDISDGEYTPLLLTTTINSRLDTLGYTNLRYSVVDNKYSQFTYTKYTGTSPSYSTANNIKIKFNVNKDGTADNDIYSFKRKIGWAFGFRGKEYTLQLSPLLTPPINIASVTSTQYIDLTGLKYIYLAIDEFGKGTQKTFISNYNISLLHKNIIAKLCLNKRTYPFGIDIVQPFSNALGNLLSEQRLYNGKIDIQRLNVVLMDDIGNPIDLNGHDFSFCLVLEHE